MQSIGNDDSLTTVEDPLTFMIMTTWNYLCPHLGGRIIQWLVYRILLESLPDLQRPFLLAQASHFIFSIPHFPYL